jgi:integrase
MAVGRITKRAVEAMTPGATDLYLWDDEIKGFGLKTTPLGHKVYLVQYRLGGRASRLRRATIGKHGVPWTPDTARKEAKSILGEIAQGVDVAAVRAAKRQATAEATTMAELATRFLTEHAEAKRKDRTSAEYRRLLDRIILPALGKLQAAAVTRQDIARLHHSLRTTPYQANRVLATLSKMFNLAEVWGDRPDGSNPCRHVEKFPERKRERFLSADELSRLGDALASYKGSPFVPALIKLLVFTGARLNEILTLEWSSVDTVRGEARIADSKTGAKIVHLPPPALSVLAELPRLSGNPYVIAGERLGRHLVNAEKPWRAIRSAAGLDDVRLHDLRHAFASVAAASGMGLPIIGKMLGHSQAQTTHRYAHLAADPVKAAAATVAGKIAEAMNGKRDSSEARLHHISSGDTYER